MVFRLGMSRWSCPNIFPLLSKLTLPMLVSDEHRRVGGVGVGGGLDKFPSAVEFRGGSDEGVL